VSHIINKFLETNQADVWSSNDDIKLPNINNRDKDDEDIIKSAINSRCDILVSGDKDYFEKRYPDIDILTPRQFLFFFK
jgi:predicted nucleic acid-binding protein